MNSMRRRLAGLGVVGAIAVVLACSGAPDATGPIADHPAIPLFRTEASCVQWSCSNPECPVNYPPGVYGACCTERDPGAASVPQPTCGSNHDKIVYCLAFPDRCPVGGWPANLGLPTYCAAGGPQDICAAKLGVSPSDPQCESASSFNYPECYPLQ